MSEGPGSATAPATRERSGGVHFPCLDGYRAIGMVMVVLTHVNFSTNHFDEARLGPYLARLDIAVPMFFIMSGFLLFRPYVLAQLDEADGPAAGRFLRRRALRIFPAYLIALAGIVAIWGAGPIDGLWDWVVNLALLQQFGVEEPYRITQAWAIGVELSFYLLLPLVAAGLARLTASRPVANRIGIMYSTVGSMFLAGTLFRVAVVTLEPSWQSWSLLWLPMYLDFFAIGMALAVASAAQHSGRDLPGPLAWLGHHPGLSWGIAFAVFALVAQLDAPPEPFGLNGNEYLPRQLGYGLAAFVWLAPALFGDQSTGRLRALLSWRPLVYAGGLSLSFYLWHLDVMGQVKEWTVPGYAVLTERAEHAVGLASLATFTGNFWIISFWTIVLAGAIAAVAHHLVEMPFLSLRNRPLRQIGTAYRETLARSGRAR